jgi:hypothetical protein
VEGHGAMLLFVYLELLDATFSMDSVMGAFSVTVDIALITLGLAIGAAYIRSLTVYVVRKGTLDEYRYLEHGAYYSIALLAILLLWEVWRDVPDWITACTGAIVITAAWLTSIWAGKRQKREEALLEASLGGTPAMVQAFTGGQSNQRQGGQGGSQGARADEFEGGEHGGSAYPNESPRAS